MFDLFTRNNIVLSDEAYRKESTEEEPTPILDEYYEFNKGFSASGYLKRICWKDFQIFYAKAKVSKDLCLKFKSHKEIPDVKMIFFVQGKGSIHVEGDRKQINFDSNSHNLIFLPISCEGSLYLNASKYWQFLDINVSSEFLNHFLPESNKCLERFKKMVQQKIPCSVSFCGMNINAQMHEIIDKILQSSEDKKLKNIYIEAKIIELLYLQLEQVVSGKSLSEAECRQKENRRKIYKARSILNKNISHPYSLPELAVKVGTNECTLKKMFKEIFGCTIFGYIHEARMQKAKKLLLGKKKSIVEISEIIGYNNVTHFITAFKKRFGITPGKFIEQNTL